MAIAVVIMAVGLGLLVFAFVRRDGGDALPERSARPISTAGSVGAVGADTGSTAPTTPDAGLGEGTVPERRGRSPLRGFGEVSVVVTAPDGSTCEVCLMAATDQAQQARGLMEVTDRGLGGYDGMLFEYPAPVDGAFYMRNTPMPLSIAYFDAVGAFVSSTDMAPCQDVPGCPTYPAARPFRYALEVPQGQLGDVAVAAGSTIRVRARTCPLAGTP